MFMVYSVAAKCIYRRLSPRYVDLKHINTIYFGGTLSLSHNDVYCLSSKKLCRHLSVKANDEKENAQSVERKKVSEKNTEKVVKQNALGDIVVKTETNVDNVVTKVTIEKTQSQKSKPDSSPGNFLMSFKYCFNLLKEVFELGML